MTTRARYEVGVGCLVVVAAGLLAYMALQVGAISGPRDTVTVKAILPDAAGLSDGAVVSIAGVQVGRVESLRVDFDHAEATITLYREAEVRKDASIATRARSVLGEKYLEVTPLTRDAALLVDGDTLVDPRGQIEIDEMVTDLGPLIAAIDPAVLRDLTAALADALRADPERPKRMLADAERLLHNAAEASEALPGLVGDTRDTLASIRRTSDEARPVVARLDGTVLRLDTLLAAVPPEQIPAILTELEAAVKDGRVVIQHLDGSTANLNDLLAKANAITGDDIERLTREDGVLIRLFPKPPPKK